MLPSDETVLMVLPYQELLGNYNLGEMPVYTDEVLPYQELLGNYNCASHRLQ